jgi:two-component sensor histidine kinase
VFSSPVGRFNGRIGGPRLGIHHWRFWGGAVAAVALVGASALIFDAVTPQIISVGIFYVGLVLIGFWFPEPKAAFALALLATLLIILGYWITVPDTTPAWEAWLNRALSIGTVWMTAVFVWYISVLEQKLKVQVDIADTLSREMNHRIGNHLQLVASFLRLQAARSSSEEVRRAIELAGSRVMVIGNIQRMLSHSTPSHMIDSKPFIAELISEVRSALPDPDKLVITVQADSAMLTSTKATALGALLLEAVNNALKHAFPDGMSGTLAVSFVVSNGKYTIELKDDGVGIEQTQTHWGFGTQNVADLTRLMGGSITRDPACLSKTRPGTSWRLVIPA